MAAWQRGEFSQHIDVAGDEMIFGDDADGIAELRQHLQAAAGDLETALDGLVAIGHAAHGQHAAVSISGRKPARARRSFGAAVFTMMRVSKSTPRGKAEVFVKRPGVAVGTAVLAAAVGIDAGVKADIRGCRSS